MSLVIVSDGSEVSSLHVQRLPSSTAPSIEKVQLSRSPRGVGPADSTGNPRSRYWPGGMRVGSTSLRRPWKPRVMGDMEVTPSDAGGPEGGGLHPRSRLAVPPAFRRGNYGMHEGAKG